MRTAEDIIRRPVLTEKTTQMRETGGGQEVPTEENAVSQKIVFEVAKDSNKVEVRQAVQKLFNVSVTDVQTMIVRSKKKRLGKFVGRVPAYKKAIVTLKKGETIEFFEGA